MPEAPHDLDLFEVSLLVPPLASAVPAVLVELMRRGVIVVRAHDHSFSLRLRADIPTTPLEARFMRVVFGSTAVEREIRIDPQPDAWRHWDRTVRRLQVATARSPRQHPDRTAQMLALRAFVQTGDGTGVAHVDERFLVYALLWGTEHAWLRVLTAVPAWWAEVSSLEQLPDVLTELFHALVAMPAGDGRDPGDPPDDDFIRDLGDYAGDIRRMSDRTESEGWQLVGRRS